MMLSKPSSIQKGGFTCQGMLICIYRQNVIKIYYVVQELVAYSLTEYGRNGPTHIKVIKVETQGSRSISNSSAKHL